MSWQKQQDLQNVRGDAGKSYRTRMPRKQACEIDNWQSDFQMPLQVWLKDDEHRRIWNTRAICLSTWDSILFSGMRKKAEAQGHERTFLARLSEYASLLQPVWYGQRGGLSWLAVTETPTDWSSKQWLPGLLPMQSMSSPFLKRNQTSWQRVRPQMCGLHRQTAWGNRRT